MLNDTNRMATQLPNTNGSTANTEQANFIVKTGLARMLKGGVIMDVVNADQVPAFLLPPLIALAMAKDSPFHCFLDLVSQSSNADSYLPQRPE